MACQNGKALTILFLRCDQPEEDIGRAGRGERPYQGDDACTEGRLERQTTGDRTRLPIRPANCALSRGEELAKLG